MKFDRSVEMQREICVHVHVEFTEDLAISSFDENICRKDICLGQILIDRILVTQWSCQVQALSHTYKLLKLKQDSYILPIPGNISLLMILGYWFA